MNYSLLSADCRTHFKIVALAIVASILFGIAANGRNIETANLSTSNATITVAKAHLLAGRSWARAENISVCRMNAL